MTEPVTRLLDAAVPTRAPLAFETVTSRVRHRRRRGAIGIAAVAAIALIAGVLVTVRPHATSGPAPLAESGRTLTIGSITVGVPKGWSTTPATPCGGEPAFDVYESVTGIGCSDMPTAPQQTGPGYPAIEIRPLDSVPPEYAGPAVVSGQPAEIEVDPPTAQRPYAVVDESFPLYRASIESRAATVAEARALLTTLRLAAPPVSLAVPASYPTLGIGSALLRDPALIARILDDLRTLPRLAPTTPLCQGLTSGQASGIGLGGSDMIITYADDAAAGCSQLIAGDGNLYGFTPQLRADLATASTALPDFSSETTAQAVAALQRAGYRVRVQQGKAGSGVPAGHVIATVPAASTLTPAGSTVTVVVSSG